MRIPQLSLCIANKPGHLVAPCQVLAAARINIVTLSLAADQQDSGTLRLIVRDWQHARDVLQAAGLAVVVNEVLAIEVRDQPGGLVELLTVFQQVGLNVEYMYAFTARLGDSAVMVFSFKDLDAAIFALARAGINPVSPVALYDHLEEA
jgi:hypothetical protein